MRTYRFLSLATALVCLCSLCQAADFLIWDVDGNHNSGLLIREALVGARYGGVYDTTITPYLGSLPDYRAIFICTGIFPDAYDLSLEPVAVDSLVSYLTNYDSTNIYLEGGYAWLGYRHHDLNPYFNIEGLANGFGDTDTILGQVGTFTEGMSFHYSGDNAFMDRIAPLSTAFVIFANNDPAYNNGIAYDDGDPSYRTIGTSFEFGGLVDGAPPSTRTILADTIMHFFRIHGTYYDWDAAVLSVDVPDFVTPGEPLTPRARVQNLGLNTATFGVACKIGTYTGTDTVYNLAPGSACPVGFSPYWIPGPAGSTYTVTVYTGLIGDQRQSNDTLREQVISWDDRWYIISPFYSGAPPTMDGRMTAGEWDSATLRDVSDFLGRGSRYPMPPGAAYLYIMNDTENVYIALDAWGDQSNTGGDAFRLWFEDNHDSSWPPYPDSTEGEFAMVPYPDPAGPSFEFWPWMSSGPPHIPYAVGVAGWSGSHAGHMLYELTIPFGTLNHHLNASSGDTVGMWLTAVDGTGQTSYAWWPTSSQLAGWNLRDHGDLIFSTGSAIVHDGGVDSIAAPPDTVWPDSTEFPAAIVRNLGNIAEMCTVSCMIEPGGYFSEVTLYLEPDLSALVNFRPWTVPLSDVTYQMTVKIVVLEDGNPGNNTLSKEIYARFVGVEELVNYQLSITNYQLHQNYPNPFGHATTIRYAVPRSRGPEARGRNLSTYQRINLSVYDVAGRLVRTLIDEEKEPGIYSVSWDRKDETGRLGAAGVYFYRLSVGDFTATRKMVVLR